MNDKSGIDWDDAFANRAYIENSMSYPPLWATRAAAFRSEADRVEMDIGYGEHPREKLDLFFPSEAPCGLVVIVHGGHLVTRMVCDDSPLLLEVLERVEGLVSISGLHDLRPLQLTAMNEHLHLTPQSAALESAVLHRPAGRAEMVCWVGGAERPEFLRQSAVLVETWGHAGAKTQLVVDPIKHHFDVIDGLKDPQSDMTRTLLGVAL